MRRNPQLRRASSFAFRAASLLAVAVVAGCFKAPVPGPPKVEEKESKSILKQTTQDIGKYDPEAGRKVSDSKIRATMPILAPLEAYGPMVEQIAKVTIDQSVTMYNIEHSKYPNYEEFMRDIIKANNVQLPVLPGKAQYQYDEANHKLVVVAPPDEQGGAAAPEEKKP